MLRATIWGTRILVASPYHLHVRHAFSRPETADAVERNRSHLEVGPALTNYIAARSNRSLHRYNGPMSTRMAIRYYHLVEALPFGDAGVNFTYRYYCN